MAQEGSQPPVRTPRDTGCSWYNMTMQSASYQTWRLPFQAAGPVPKMRTTGLSCLDLAFRGGRSQQPTKGPRAPTTLRLLGRSLFLAAVGVMPPRTHDEGFIRGGSKVRRASGIRCDSKDGKSGVVLAEDSGCNASGFLRHASVIRPPGASRPPRAVRRQSTPRQKGRPGNIMPWQ